MNRNPALDPTIPMGTDSDAIKTILIPRPRDLGGFEVRRALPSVDRQTVGPFTFFDQFGPTEFLTSAAIDLRPHPRSWGDQMARGQGVNKSSIFAKQPLDGIPNPA